MMSLKATYDNGSLWIDTDGQQKHPCASQELPVYVRARTQPFEPVNRQFPYTVTVGAETQGCDLFPVRWS